ncbi:MAG: hypothetical protein ACRDRH_11165 [Pseudonocardia sp.]
MIRKFDALERRRGADAVIDYDCVPTDTDVEPYPNRFAALDDLLALQQRRLPEPLAEQVQAHVTYLSALLGERLPLGDFVKRTQGCDTAGWTADYLDYRRDIARAALAEVDVSWGARTLEELRAVEAELSPDAVGEAIKGCAAEHERYVRDAVASETRFNLQIESVESNEYWSYWLDGSGFDARLRINAMRASFTPTDVYRFALHEALGHALQYASISNHARTDDDIPWLPLLAVHSNHQVLFEGIGQILPLVFDRENKLVNTFVRLDHYRQLVRADLHLLINDGATVAECRDMVGVRAPFMSPEVVERELRDRSLNPRFRSYLWAYPAGLDWFMCLFEASSDTLTKVLRAAYRTPLTPSELQSLWPDGPAIGGNR